MNFQLFSVSILSTMLAACGGGGSTVATSGGTGTSTSATNTASPTTNSGNLATSAPTPTYPAGSFQLAMFNQLNDVRLKGGFGMLAQDVVLDKADTNHANYLVTNYYNFVGQYGLQWNPDMSKVDPATGWLQAHVEVEGKPGFTGVLPVNRVASAGSTYSYIGEVIAFISPPAPPTDCVGVLLNTVFHRNALLNTQLSTIGIGYSPTPDSKSGACVINPSMKSTPNIRPEGWTGIYPGENQTSVPTGMGGEAPDPAPNIPNSQKGSPVSIYLNSALASVNSFTLTAAGSTVQVPTVQLTYADFPKYLTKNEAHILPTQLLASKTTYKVNFAGTMSDGTISNRSWSFTTQ